METKNLIIIVVVALVAVVAGGAVGMSVQQQKDAPMLAEAEKLSPTIKALSSKIVPSIVAYGQVVNIEGRTLTLSYLNETLAVSVNENAKVVSYYSASGDSKTSPKQQEAVFSDIKKGDSVNISLKVSADGSIAGQFVTILMKAK